jgi:hypothetical protein
MSTCLPWSVSHPAETGLLIPSGESEIGNLNLYGRLVLPAQPVDATPSNQLIRQYFPWRTDLFGCTRSKPSQGSVPADLTQRALLAFVFNA